MIVVDASLLVRAVLTEGAARDVLAEEDAAVPHLADAEVLHALRDQERRAEIDSSTAATALATWSALGVHRFGSDVLLDRVWELRHNLSAYDATYVALAELLECELATADGRLARAPGPRCSIRLITG